MAGYTRTERLIKEGRGQGTGKDYKPWIHVRDFSSQGKVSRIQGWKSGRAIQCLSSLETALARLLVEERGQQRAQLQLGRAQRVCELAGDALARPQQRHFDGDREHDEREEGRQQELHSPSEPHRGSGA